MNTGRAGTCRPIIPWSLPPMPTGAGNWQSPLALVASQDHEDGARQPADRAFSHKVEQIRCRRSLLDLGFRPIAIPRSGSPTFQKPISLSIQPFAVSIRQSTGCSCFWLLDGPLNPRATCRTEPFSHCRLHPEHRSAPQALQAFRQH